MFISSLCINILHFLCVKIYTKHSVLTLHTWPSSVFIIIILFFLHLHSCIWKTLTLVSYITIHSWYTFYQFIYFLWINPKTVKLLAMFYYLSYRNLSWQKHDFFSNWGKLACLSKLLMHTFFSGEQVLYIVKCITCNCIFQCVHNAHITYCILQMG